jgi:hypothetical protein
VKTTCRRAGIACRMHFPHTSHPTDAVSHSDCPSQEDICWSAIDAEADHSLDDPDPSDLARFEDDGGAGSPEGEDGDKEAKAGELCALIASVSDTVYRNHPWQCFCRRELARQHLGEATAKLARGDTGGAADAARRAAEIVSLDKSQAVLSYESRRLTDVGQRAWRLLWRDLNLRSRRS